mgnify:CR=1 FL=1
MDNIQHIHPYTPILMAVISILLLLATIYYAKPWLLGMIGSSRIQKKLSELAKKGATVMNHIQLTTRQGDVLHLDHLIITNTQVICVSILGYAGEIMGSIRASTWTQETSQGSHRFPNPIKHHETIKNTIQAALGDKLEVKAISAFTAGNLHTDSDEVTTAAQCAETLHSAIEEGASGSKQQWASNILRNIALTGADSKRERELAFIARQGNEQQLKISRYTMGTSALLMLVAVILAGIRSAAQHGLF